MIDIVVRQQNLAWRVEKARDLLMVADDEAEAVLFALGEASRCFEGGERAQVTFQLAS